MSRPPDRTRGLEEPESACPHRAPGAARTIRLVAEREIRIRGRSRAFRIFTAVQVVAVVAVVVIAGLTSGSGPTTYHVGLHGAPTELAAAARAAPAFGARLAVTGQTADQARRALRTGKLDAALLDGTLVTGPSPPAALIALLEGAHRDAELRASLAAAHVDARTAGSILAPAALPRQRVASAHQVSGGARALAAIGAILLYVALLGAGATVASGVVEEKTSWVVEIILSTMTPGRLLAGKVLGVGLLSLGQLLATVIAGLAVALAAGVVALPHATGGVAALLALWFALGYALFACAFAAVGALVSRQEDLAGAQLPLMLILGVGYGVSISLSDPSSPLAVILTFVPPVAPMIVPVREALGGLPVWQLAASVVLSLVFTMLLIRLAGRLYGDGVLRTGAPVRLGRALRELRTGVRTDPARTP